MISVVICSINEAKFAAVNAMYRELLGGAASGSSSGGSSGSAGGVDEFEIIRIPDARSMCEGYNRGFAQSRGEVLIFSHDDIEIHAPDFRQRLLGHLQRADVVGIAGTPLLCGPAWAAAGPPFVYGHLGHYHPEHNIFEAAIFAAPARHIGNMQALDGVFLACRRKVVEAIPFDEQTFTHFHHYDLDFTYRAYLAGFKLAVCCDLDLIHFSNGTWGEAWKSSGLRFMQKHAATIPQGARVNWNRMSARVATREECVARLRWPHWDA
jgi:GT2 family glycosyltransferase